MTMRVLPIALSLLAAGALLTGCAIAQPETAADEVAGVVLGDALAEAGFDGSEPRALVESLDALRVSDRPANLIVSVTSTELIVQPEEPGERRIPFADQPFYLSVAPYLTQTHPCTFHSLTTCIGEQRNQPVAVRVVDADTGTVYVEESRTTADNGFTGLWLPRDVRVAVTMTIAGKTGTVVTSTGLGDPTCLTTLQLT
ncbi:MULTISPECIES: CueP family metal-binding protein [unclassified Leucobacter]|uniref:CueP family metal-binding protein n=1 Tax=unclassified Leucobacter TaxID=2621730 RepID=UPI00165E0453|nr:MULTISPECIES: CueP family metal-binding protein [unclassified Leucobacter]MBC9926162.1 CueP family metal-binding protein [Leucobacter sp. cx-169]